MCQQLDKDRQQTERRSSRRATFPLWDNERNLVCVDRRDQADRRLENNRRPLVE